MNKMLQKEINLSALSSAKVNNEKSYISSPPACLKWWTRWSLPFYMPPPHTHTHRHACRWGQI